MQALLAQQGTTRWLALAACLAVAGIAGAVGPENSGQRPARGSTIDSAVQGAHSNISSGPMASATGGSGDLPDLIIAPLEVILDPTLPCVAAGFAAWGVSV